MNLPLENIRVLDLSRVYAAPAGTMILADLGADVIRIEPPNGSDSMREWGPFVNGVSTYYISANRNKRSMTLNLKTDKGKEIFLDLVKNSDVVVENFKTGTLDRLGLNYEKLKEVNAQLIMCSVTGYGQTGPYKNEPGFDPVIQALSGLMEVNGQSNGEPTKVGIPIADILTSHYVAISIISAIRMRDINQVGQYIDLSLLDVQMTSMANVSSSYLNTGNIPKRVGNRHSNVVPYQIFNCKDQPIMLCVGNNGLFAKLCKLLERDEWIYDNRFNTNDQRLKNEEELVSMIAKILKEKNADDWLGIFSEGGIPSGRVNNIQQAFEHPQVMARDLVETYYHPTTGTIKTPKNPIRFSNLQLTNKYPPPLLGEHTEDILSREQGFSKEEVEKLRERNII